MNTNPEDVCLQYLVVFELFNRFPRYRYFLIKITKEIPLRALPVL